MKISSQFEASILKTPFSQGCRQGNLRKRLACAVGGVSLGILTRIYQGTSSGNVVFAHGNGSTIEHAMNEIIQHVIWEKAGSVLGIGHFATGLLGELLSFQSLGEKDVFYIPQPISRPILSKCINPKTGNLDDCLTLANGKQLFGKEILAFAQSLQHFQFVPGESK